LTGDKVKRTEKDKYAFILVSDEARWNQLCECSQATDGSGVFIRKSRVAPKFGQKLLFYIKKPDAQIRGVAVLVERLTGSCQTLWEQLGKESCFHSFDEYQDFIEGRETATFVRFKNLRVFETPISGLVFSSQVGFPLSPRGGRYLTFEEFSKLEV
jgi:predicted transcriptional regulator